MHHDDDNKYVLYLRKSTDTSDKQVQSLADQESTMMDLAERRELNVVEIISESKSAKEPNSRKGFASMLKLIESGKVNGILTYSFDRLSRNPVDSANVKWLLQKEVVKKIVTSVRDYHPEDNVLLMSVESAMANEYIRKLRRDVRRGMVSKFKRGDYPSCAPIGYYNCPYDRTIKVNDTYFHIIRKIWDLMLTGRYSVAQVHDIAVSDWKVITPKRKRSGGTLISKSQVYKIFHNEFYMGIMNWAGMTQIGNHKPMVTTEEFNRVKTLIKNNTRTKTTVHKNNYAGIFRCANCKCQITAECRIKNGKTYNYYRCTGKSKFTVCTQRKERVNQHNLENQISDTFNSLVVEPEFYGLALEVIQKSKKHVGEQQVSIIKQLEDRVENIKKQKVRLTDLLVDGVLEKEEFIPRQDKLKKEHIQLRLKLREAKSKRTKQQFNPNDIFEKLKGMGNHKKIDIDERKALIRWAATEATMLDRRLNLKLVPWLTPISEFNIEYHTDCKRFELSIDNPIKGNRDFSKWRSRWCEVVKQVCTLIQEN